VMGGRLFCFLLRFYIISMLFVLTQNSFVTKPTISFVTMLRLISHIIKGIYLPHVRCNVNTTANSV
jgi:hypothetical protein